MQLLKTGTATYSVSGTISTSDSADTSGALVQLKNSGGAVVGSAVAGAGGAYSITGIPAGTYTATVTLLGYDPGTITGITVSGANVTVPECSLNKDNIAPGDVTNLSAAAGDAKVLLTWNDPPAPDLAPIEITWSGGSASAPKGT
ncbi:MAG: carboxypeptidase-like regulatory domain-containing protein [Treponema sp.]|nr:carboxypeptidase-like regulatory domain-containing protein [Treponema sp.]